MLKRIILTPLVLLVSLLCLNGLAFGQESTPFDYALFGDESIKMSGNALTDSYDSDLGDYSPGAAGEEGDVRSNADITLNGKAKVKGDALPGPDGSIKIEGKAKVTGSTTPATTILPLDPVRIPEGIPNSGPLKLSGKQKKTLEAGTYWYTEIKLSGKVKLYVRGKVVIYCTGDINLSGDAFVNGGSPVDLEIYCRDESKEVKLTGKSEFYGVIYAPAAYIKAEGDHNTYGVLIGNKIKISGNGRIHYDKAVGRAHEKVPPVITNLIPEPDSLINDNRPPISAGYYDEISGIDVQTVRIVLDSEDVTALSTITENQVSYTPATELSDGLHNVMVEVKDKAGNSARSNWSFTVDATPPAITNLIPVPDSLINQNKPIISADYEDALSGIDTTKVKLFLNGEDITSLSTITREKVNYIPVTDLADGIHPAKVEVKDRAGNSAQASWSFTIDLIPPEINITRPLDGSTIETNTPLITVTYADAESGVDLSSLSISINGTDKTSAFTITNNEATYQIPEADSLPEGENTIAASISDQAGNQAATSSTFTVKTAPPPDTTPPEINITQPLDGSTIETNTPLITVTYADAESGVDLSSLNISINGTDKTLLFTITNTQASYQIPEADPLPEGENTIQASISDQAGNPATTSSTFTVETAPPPDTTPPDLNITQPVDGSTITSNTPLITITYSDDNSGVDVSSLRVLINGTDKTSFFTATDNEATYQVPEADPLPEGENTIQASIFDLAGNQATASSTFTVSTGAPPITPSSGFIHGYVYDAKTELPLQGAIITAKDIEGFVSSDNEGKFCYPTPEGGEYLLTVTKPGYTYAQRWAEVVSTRDTSVDPVYLTPLDPEVTTITPEGGTATNSTGTLELIFPPGAVSEPIDVQATWCEKAEHLPFPLPPNSIFTYAASFEPAETRFDQPVTLRVKNTLGFDPGTPIPIGFYNRENIGKCKWEPVGMGEVLEDGEWSEYTIYRFSWYDCNLAPRLRRGLKAPTPKEPNIPENKDPAKWCTSSAGSRVSIKTGDLYIDHTLPSTRTLGVSKSLILTYASSTANPSVLFETESNIDDFSAFWTRTSGYLLEVEGIRKEIKYASRAGDARQAFLFDGRNARGKILSTGSYPYNLTLSNDFDANYATANFFGGLPDRTLDVLIPFFVPRSSSIRGRFIIHNQVDSPFGAGWGLAGLQRLHLDPEGDILLTEGDGSSLVFSKRQFAYTANTGENSVSVIDISSDKVVKTIPVGYRPSAVAITPDAKYAYVVNNLRKDVSVVDISRNIVISTITVGSWPWELEVSPDGRYVYVGNFTSHNISVIETSSNTVVSTIGGVRYPYGVAFTPDSRYAYVTNFWDNTVSVINTSSHTVVRIIPVGSRPEGVAVTPDGRYAYVCNTQSDDVFVIDTSSDTVVATVSVGDYPVVPAITPDSRYVYVPNHYSGTVSVIDTSSNAVVDTVSVGGGATVVDITPDGRYAYVTTWWSDSVTVIDIFRCNTVVGKIPVGDGPRGIAIMSKVPDTFIPPSGEFSTFVRNPDGTYTRTMKDGTRHNFNSKGLHIATVDRNGNTTTYTYDEQDRLISITDPVGQLTSLTYSGDRLSTITDPAGRVTRSYYDNDGNLIMITNPDGTSKSFTYNSKHLLTSKTDERGNVTSYIYDNYGRISEVHSPEHEVLKDGQLTREARISRFRPADTQHLINDLPEGVGTPDNPAPVVKPEEVRYEVEEDCCDVAKRTGETDKFGGVTEETDALGRTTSIDRDMHSNPTKITQPNGAITTMAYDTLGNLLTSTEQSISATTTFTYEPNFNQVTSIKDPKGNTTTLEYDARGNPTKIKDALGNITIMAYDSRGLLVSTTDALGNQTTFTYDSKGNLISTTDPLGNITTLAYDLAGNVISSTDALGRTTRFTYDLMNRLTRVIDADDEITSYEYDQAGNLTTITDARGNATGFTYNEMNQLTKTTNPLGQEKNFYYDLRKNLARTIDPKGQVIDYTYDVINQLISKAAPDNTYTYTYDEVGNLTGLVENDSDLVFSYDLANRLIQAQTGATIAQPATTISYTYDKNGNRLTMTDPEGGATNYTYDALNRLTSLTSPQNQTTTYNYDQLSRRINLTLPNGISTDYTYDLASQLLSITNQLSTINYTYNNVGNRLSMTDTDGAHNYTYDNLNRLIQATHPNIPTESFNYDPVGNRQGGVYDAANRLLEDNDFTYTYDANGNLTSKTEKATGNVTTYHYDAENQLTRIDLPDGTYAAYRYDGLGRRIEKDVNGVITKYIYDNEDIISDLNALGSVLATYTHGPGIDEPISMNRAGQTYWYHADALGSIRQLSDNTGAVVQSYTYDSFGSIVDQTGFIPNPYTFTSREYNPESDLYYYRARYYDSRLARFLQVDPLLEKTFFASSSSCQGFCAIPSLTILLTLTLPHPYVYVGNNPINLIDPLGYQARVFYLIVPTTPSCVVNITWRRNECGKMQGYAILICNTPMGQIRAQIWPLWGPKLVIDPWML